MQQASNEAALLIARLNADDARVRLAAVQRVRMLAAVAANKAALCEAGGVEALVELLRVPQACSTLQPCSQAGADAPRSALAPAVEALSCLIADNLGNRVRTAACFLCLPALWRLQSRRCRARPLLLYACREVSAKEALSCLNADGLAKRVGATCLLKAWV